MPYQPRRAVGDITQAALIKAFDALMYQAKKMEAAGHDCPNPGCPYRAQILAERARQRTKAAKWRARKAKP